MKKNLCFVAAFLMTALSFAGGKKDSVEMEATPVAVSVPEQAEKTPDSVEKIRLGILNGPTGIAAAYLMENPSEVKGAELSVEKFASVPAELPKLLKGEIDIGFLPANVAAKVYNSNKGAVVALGICGNGNLSVISTDPSLNSFEGLKGKTLYAAGQASTPEYMALYLLGKKNIPANTKDGVTLDFSIPTADIAAALISGKISCALVPEPFATVATIKSDKVKRSIDIQKEYAALENGESYPLTLLVVNAKYAAEHADQVASFIEAYKKAVEWTNANANQAGVLVQKHTLGLMAPIAAKAIPNAAFVWTPAVEGKAEIEKLLSIFLATAPESVGGSLPNEGFFYAK